MQLALVSKRLMDGITTVHQAVFGPRPDVFAADQEILFEERNAAARAFLVRIHLLRRQSYDVNAGSLGGSMARDQLRALQ